MSPAGSTTRRMQLGAHLRRLREARGISRAQAGYAIRASESKISRLELGRVGFKDRDVADLLVMYGVTEGPQYEELVRLAAAANQAGWWQRYNDVLPPWMGTYLGLEESASLVRAWENQFVPTVLQTVAYATALIQAAHSKDREEDRAHRLALVRSRQRAFFRDGGPRLWAVIDEAVLLRPVGGPAVLRAQLEHLRTLPQNVTLQILPLGTGAHPALHGPFTVLRFPYPDLHDMAWVQSHTTAAHHEKSVDVDAHLEILTFLTYLALTPDDTHARLTALAKPT